MSRAVKGKVVVGMSGGVDSSMTAALLKDEGYEVIGITMQLWQAQGPDIPGGCCTVSAIDDARKVASLLDIPHYVMNFRNCFEEKVVDYFTQAYLRGETPNPCLACNRFVKFGELWHRARGLGADYMATGHYARIWQDPVGKRYMLGKGLDSGKDQTYALYVLTQEQLEHTLLPLGNYRKEDVRAMARQQGLTAVAAKPDSQEICFVPDNDYAGFISNRVRGQIQPGLFVDRRGSVLGQHRGLIHYTIGQRKGLGVTFGKPMFVIGLNAAHNEVVLGEDSEVYAKTLWADELNWIAIPTLTEPMAVKAKIRYKATEAEAVIYPIYEEQPSGKAEDRLRRVKVEFEKPQRAITPGQSVVFYHENKVVGGGRIISDPLGNIINF